MSWGRLAARGKVAPGTATNPREIIEPTPPPIRSAT